MVKFLISSYRCQSRQSFLNVYINLLPVLNFHSIRFENTNARDNGLFKS